MCPTHGGAKQTETSEFRAERGLLQGPSKGYGLLVLKRPKLPSGLGVRVFKDKICGEGYRRVTFFWLVGGEVTGWCSRTLVLGLKLPSSTWVGALVPIELRDCIRLFCISMEEELGLCFIDALLYTLTSHYLNLHFGTQGRSRKLRSFFFYR